MLELFRSKTLFALAGLLLFGILFRLATLMGQPPALPELSTPFSVYLFGWLGSHNLGQNTNEVIALLLLLLQAFLINYISSAHNIIYKDSVMPGLFFMLLNSLYLPQLQLTPQLIATTFLLLMFNRLCYLYESEKPLFLVFDAGILLGLGVLMEYGLIIYLPFILLSVLYMTSFNLRYWLVAILGMALPLYFLGVITYLMNHFTDFQDSLQHSLEKTYFNTIRITLVQGIVWMVILPAFVFSLLDLQINFLRNRVKTRRIQLMLLVMLLFGLVSVLAEDQGYLYGISFLSVPLSLILTNYFIRSGRKWMKETLFFLLLACIVYYHYFQ